MARGGGGGGGAGRGGGRGGIGGGRIGGKRGGRGGRGVRGGGSGVRGQKAPGNRGIQRPVRRDVQDMIKRFNDIRSRLGSGRGPSGERKQFRGRSGGGRGGGAKNDLLQIGVEELCAMIADAAIEAAIATAYDMCGNEGQEAIVGNAVDTIGGVWEAVFEGDDAEIAFDHPEAVGQIEEAVNEILSDASDQCALLREIGEGFLEALDDNDGFGDYDTGWY